MNDTIFIQLNYLETLKLDSSVITNLNQDEVLAVTVETFTYGRCLVTYRSGKVFTQIWTNHIYKLDKSDNVLFYYPPKGSDKKCD